MFLNYLFAGFGIKDLVDSAIVAFSIYKLLMFFRSTRAIQVLNGLLILLVATFATNSLQLYTVNFILKTLWTVWIVAGVVVFQPELRSALARIGDNRLIDFFLKKENLVNNELIKAVLVMSRKKTGCLIVLAKKANLRNFIETGVPINAEITAELLVSVFTPLSPIHDGAVIVRENRIAAAGCILPLTKNPGLDKAYGTRHRAGLGMSEDTDAVVLIVSEESGAVSLAFSGKLYADLGREELGRLLTEHYSSKASL